MDHHRFDALTRALGTASRRDLLGRLAVLPVVGGLFGLLADHEAVAKGRRKRRKKRHKHGQGNGRHRKGKRNRTCKPKSRATICAGKCGIVKNRKTCQKKVDCGPCVACGDVCASGCPFRSIQEAITAADAGATIQLCAESYRGVVGITKDLTLLGAGQESTTLEGEGRGSAVFIDSNVTAHLEALHITGVDGAGSGVSNSGVLTLTKCSVTHNVSSTQGGGIYNAVGATLTLTDCSVTDNEAEAQGGGVFNAGNVTLTDCSVTDNETEGQGGGVYNSGNVTLTNSSVTENTAGDTGGGIFTAGAITADENSTIADNNPDQCVEGLFGTGCP